MTSSRLPTATDSPNKVCARLRALFKSKMVRRRITSARNSMNASNTPRTLNSIGRPRFSAIIFTGKFVCISVYWNKWFKTTSAIASRFNSITTRKPSLDDSSRISEIPSMRFSLLSSAILIINCALFTWYGISSTTIAWWSRKSSTCVLERTIIDPRPVVCAL